MLPERTFHIRRDVCQALKICQQFKNRDTIYGRLTPKNTAKPKRCDAVHVDLIGTYRKSIRQQQTGGDIIFSNLACMKMINPAMGWFEIIEVPTFDLDGVTVGNNKYIDK